MNRGPLMSRAQFLAVYTQCPPGHWGAGNEKAICAGNQIVARVGFVW
jgi:hypothetical protein